MEKPNKTFLTLLGRLLANWPVDDKRLPGLSREMFAVFNEVGESRFAAGVDSIIRENPYKLFPTAAELRGYIPEKAQKPYCSKCTSGWIYVPDYEARRLYRNTTAMAVIRCDCGGNAKRWQPTAADYADRDAHPEDYWGVPDVICMMRAQANRIAQKKPLYNLKQIEQIILRAREKYGHRYQEVFQPKRRAEKVGPDYEMTDEDYL